MIEEPTVFILGAGASRPYGYPTGRELRQEIISNCGINKIRGLLEQGGRGSGLNSYINAIEEEQLFGQTFDKSSAYSIDLFLSRKPRFGVIGKIEIAHAIKNREKASGFNEKTKDNAGDWYSFLYDRMTEKIKTSNNREAFSKNEIEFITFNYDRSLEYYIYTSLANSFYETSHPEIKSLTYTVKSIPITHVYGVIDENPNINFPEYGKKAHLRDIINMSECLKLIDERRIDSESEHKIKRAIKNAKRIFFLGFGFAAENMDILGFPLVLEERSYKIYATAKGAKEKRIKDIREKIGSLRSDIHIEDMDCLKLLEEYL